MKINILYDELKKNGLINNLLLVLIVIYPISIVAGPALIEFTIFCSIITFFFSYKIEMIKEFYLKFKCEKFLVFMRPPLRLHSEDRRLMSLKNQCRMNLMVIPGTILFYEFLFVF